MTPQIKQIHQIDNPVLQLAYVLTSSGADPFLEQFYMSVMSLRHHGNAHTKVVLVTDRLTYESCGNGPRKAMLEAADEIIVVDLDETLSGKVRSRLLKTQLRKFVKGDYLYIDTDTLIATNIEKEIESLQAIDLGAVDDQNTPWLQFPEAVRTYTYNRTKGIFPMEEITESFNGGAMWVKDNDSAHRFYKMWHNLYLEGEKQGCSFDQPSLETTQLKLGLIRHIDGGWNTQGVYGVRYYSKIKVFHYYCTGFPEPTHEFRDEAKIKKYAVDYMNGTDTQHIEDILDDFMNGYTDRVWLAKWEENPAYVHPLYWFIVNNGQKKWFKVFDRLGVLLNKIIR